MPYQFSLLLYTRTAPFHTRKNTKHITTHLNTVDPNKCLFKQERVIEVSKIAQELIAPMSNKQLVVSFPGMFHHLYYGSKLI